MLKVESKDSGSRGGTLDGFARRHVPDGATGAAGGGSVSVVGGGMTVTGDVKGGGEVRIEGRVEGSVSTNGRVVVDTSGEVEGGIEAGEVVASGRVSGRITAKNAVRLKNGCRIEADVHAPAIELEEGGVVNGRLEMKSGEMRSAAKSSSDGKPDTQEKQKTA